MSDSTEQLVAEIVMLFETKGAGMYAGEPVTQLQHALQAAELAEQQGAAEALVVAALLHDIGHLLHAHGEDCALSGIDDQHEQRGAVWLAERFPVEVVEPVRLHVAAKRYRCATDAAYYNRLSTASRLSLSLQGGPLDAGLVDEFQSNPFFENALLLRSWDEAAKRPDHVTPPLDHFRPALARVIRSKMVS